MDAKYGVPADLVCEAMSRLYFNGLTSVTGGNISIRDDQGNTWVSPTRLDKGYLKPSDIVKVTPEGELVGNYKPSIEYQFHRGILDEIPWANAVVHAHCPNCTAFCALGEFPDLNLWHDAKVEFEGQFGRVPFNDPGTPELRDDMLAQAKAGKSVIFMDHHGVTVGGKDIADAMRRIEMLEKLCSMAFLAHQVGTEVKTITGEVNCFCAPIEVSLETLPASFKERNLRKELAHHVERMYVQHMVYADSASCSVKVDETSFLVTPRNVDLRKVTPEELVLVKDGKAYGGEPARDWKLHAEFYAAGKGECVFFCTPDYYMAFANTNAKMNMKMYMGLKAFKTPVELPYEATVEEIVAAFTPDTPTVVVANRFVGFTAGNPQTVFNRLETLEAFARVQVRGAGWVTFNDLVKKSNANE